MRAGLARRSAGGGRTEAAAWRTDPLQAGPGGAISNIGSHAFHLACFVTGRVPEQILAELSRFVRSSAEGARPINLI